MWIRLLGVFFLLTAGLAMTIGTVTAVPVEAPLLQLTNTPTNTATSTATPTATATATPTPTGTPTPTPTTTITPFPPGIVDLQILMSASLEPVATGDQLIYTITVTNFTAVGATSPQTTMTDTLPAGVVLLSATGGGGCTSTSSTTFGGGVVTCTVPALGPNLQMIFTITVQVTAATGTSLFNTAQVDLNNGVIETNESNNVATTTTTVGATAVPSTTAVPTNVPLEPTPIPPGPAPTAVRLPPPTTGGTPWVRILSPQQVYSVTDDPLWIAQSGELYWIERDESGWLLVVWEGDSKMWSVWIRDQGVERLTLDRPAPPDAGDLWLVVFRPVQTYFEDMSPAWMAMPGEWYFLLLREAGWALVRYEFDPPNIVVWIQEVPGVEYTTFDAPHQIG